MNGEALDRKPPWPARLRMNTTMSVEPVSELAQARHRVEACCQSLVDIGQAQWQVNGDGDTELHLASGEAYLFGELGVTRLR